VRYFDTSALVKQYFLKEPGSKTVRELLKSGEKVFTAVLSYTETHAAFARRRREGLLSAQVTRRLALRFDRDWESYEILLLSGDALALARELIYRHPLRSADAIHLASALLLARKTPASEWEFVCADKRLRDAATSEGLSPIYVASSE